MIKKAFALPTRQPAIVKFSQIEWSGIQPHLLTRHTVGFILKGRKLIYYEDSVYQAEPGDMFYLGTGYHYTEDIPGGDTKPFEQITIHFTPEQLSRIFSQLGINYGMTIANHHACENCNGRNYVVYPGWENINHFFSSVNQYLKDDITSKDKTAESIKMTELVYLIASNPDCCLQNKLLEHSDSTKEGFEDVVQRNIFRNISIEELAQQSNRSLTSFKKEFRKHFSESPHKWFIRQRLMHSRLLLISTGKSVAEIAAECNFSNTSHFIKLFRKEFGLTPSVYRNHYDKHENRSRFSLLAESDAGGNNDYPEYSIHANKKE